MGLEHERNSRYDQLCTKLKVVDDKLTSGQETSGKKFVLLKDQIGKFSKELEDERSAREM